MLVLAVLLGLQSAAPELPVSLDRIRAALAQAGAPLLITPPAADFSVHIRERTADEGIVPSLDFRSGPLPPGGLYAYEQRRRLGTPYAEQPLIEVDVLPIGRAIGSAISRAHRAAVERNARTEVEESLTAFCERHACR